MSKSYFFIFLLNFYLLGLGCAGPTTPFGGLKSFSVKEISKDVLNNLKRLVFDNQTKIFVVPKKQVLHKMEDVWLVVEDSITIPEKFEVKVFYNRKDISHLLPSKKTYLINESNTQIKIKIPHVLLRTDLDQDVVFVYISSEKKISFLWEPPTCPLFTRQEVIQTDPFNVDSEMIEKISLMARSKKINPSLFVGLVAQESSFDPKAVSYAKAIGLTQITNLAEKEIVEVHSEWPRHPAVQRYPSSIVKELINTEKINEENEWRLNPEFSIEGGLTYLYVLINYWRRSQHLDLLNTTFSESEEDFSKVLLASYNSGAARVKYQIQLNGTNFLKAHTLKEAQNYVKRIQSFCYHFSHEDKL